MAGLSPDRDISASVGRRGVNRPQDVQRVKEFLNRISSEEGGTDGTLDESDSSAVGADFEMLVKAIIIFQYKNFRNEFQPDGLVERGRKTHKALAAMSHRALMPIDLVDAFFMPAVGHVRDTDHRGYSRAGLKQAHPVLPSDWTTRVPNATPIQMVPTGDVRTLVVNSAPGFTFEFKLADDSPRVATLNSSGTSVTLTGQSAGDGELQALGPSGVAATATVRVRAPATITVNTVHLGRPRISGSENNFAALVPAISRLYEPQTNVRFVAGSISVLERLNGVAIDPDKDITDISTLLGISMDYAKREMGIEQPFSIHEVGKSFPNAGTKVLTIFFSPRIQRIADPKVAGSAERIGGRMAWFRIGVSQNSKVGVTEVAVPAHEIGHLLGFHHITAPSSETYLMNEGMGLNNMRIPSDTLTELRV